ncbi:hypothetical protein LguiB_011560 [Lonicera macranthoides]
MLIQQQRRFFEHLSLYVIVLLLLSYNKLVSRATLAVVGDGTMKRPGCMENEREALLEFKQGIVDDYGILSSWGPDKKDCCKWRGVKCSNRTGHVIVLDLQNRDQQSHPFAPNLFYHFLRGKIGSSLLQLQHLKHLDLSNNDFGSRIPEFLGSLSRLLYLNLGNAYFHGEIPHQIGNLTNLRSLQLGGDPTVLLSVKNLEWLSNLRLLRRLHLSYVDLGKIDWIQPINKIPFLSELYLVSCKLPGIISSSLHLNNFSSIPLTIIDLSDNNFISSSVYHWLFNFSSCLVDIDLSLNPLGGSIPSAFGNMESIQNLNLNNCLLKGEIPKSFRNLSHLCLLDLSYNTLTGILPQLFEMFIASENSLEVLNLGGNKLSGSLPDFTRVSSLRELDLSQNELNGSFPERFGRISKLDSLFLTSNKLKGSVPDLTSFPLLRNLYLRDNKLNGRVPESIGQLSMLKVLVLSYNSLTSEFSSDWTPVFQLDAIGLGNCKLGPHFPKWLRSQNNFSMLNIGGNGISDTIPNWFWDLSPRLVYLNISKNQFHGPLPDLSLLFVNFAAVDINSNSFEGPIPSLPPNTSYLNLSKNRFSGSVSTLCTIMTEFLHLLDLSNNLLSGEVPDCWIKAKELEILDLASNNFSGKIPTSFGFLYRLQFLSLHNNNFMGEVPSSLKNCTLLEVNDMSANQLSGKVPSWIGTHLTSLVILSFRRNKLYGSIPPSICHLNRTQVLDLSQNNISRNIPSCFNKLTSLVRTSSLNGTVSFLHPGGVISYSNGEAYVYYTEVYMARALVQWKGKVSEYRSTLGLLKFIDLSSNKLVGKIPEELTTLEGLVSLNLSRNNLTGNVIQTIGQMKMLEILDLSENQLSGEIPTSLASLNFLSVLDLSSNNLSGKIPTSTQLQSFNASVYAHNRELCGLPLPNKCPEDESASVPPSTDHGKDETNEEEEDTFVTTGFYICLLLGFTLVFWGFFGPLLIRSSWRNAYFKFLDKIKDWICVTIAVNMARLQRKVKG